jgi:V/A-type H+-transporting ATPase subunit K
MPLDMLTTLVPLQENVSAAASSSPAIPEGSLDYFGAALAVGLAALASGYAERGIGSAAVGAMAEDESLFIRGVILTVLPETLVIFTLLVVFLAL